MNAERRCASLSSGLDRGITGPGFFDGSAMLDDGQGVVRIGFVAQAQAQNLQLHGIGQPRRV